MRLAEMVKREDFYSILRETVREYFLLTHNQDVACSYKKTNGKKWIVNGKMGFISRFPAPPGLRKFLLTEYNVRGSKLKFIIGKAAALILGTFPQIGKWKNIYITPDILGRNVFISPQNRSIRFFDYDEMTVDCIVKTGFSSKYFTNQLNFRKMFHYNFMLPILDSSDRWFREPILTGHALARVTDEAQYQRATRDALAGIGQLAADTLSHADSSAYAATLMKRISDLLRDAEVRKQIQCSEQTHQLAELAVRWIDASPMEIPLCMSHGDFQSGNIWVDNCGKTWVYDWETVGRRSVWYDSAVLNYSLRREYGWKSLLEDLSPHALFCCDPEKKHAAPAWQGIKGIILLEDILFYLEDMLELPEDWGKEIYDGYIQRMEALLLL